MKTQKKQQAISLQVTDGLAVAIIPETKHEFLMTTREVAKGYDTSMYVVRKNFNRLSLELKHGKHYLLGKDILKGETNCPPPVNIQKHQVFWTKRGVIRLGFSMRSQGAKLFRDWAEDLVIEELKAPEPLKHLPSDKKRKHNRLTSARMLDIMSDVVRIEDKALRLSLTQKLGL